MNIKDLLNPLPEPELGPRTSPTVRKVRSQTDEDASEYSPEPRATKKRSPNKLAKDGPKFEEGPTRGEIRFPPHEISSNEMKVQLAKFQIVPMSGISSYPRHIPYTSEKKDFQAKTGRDALEVFEYTFKFGDQKKDWVVMWDYNIGLVRITPFFKCLGYVKTVPSKAVGATPGLKDICYSITGGAIAAQGYWLPYRAAKALAANFCFEIRHALIPVFGVDFPDICVHPDNSDYQRFGIASEVVVESKKDVASWNCTENMLVCNEDISTRVLSPETVPPTQEPCKELAGDFRVGSAHNYDLVTSQVNDQVSSLSKVGSSKDIRHLRRPPSLSQTQSSEDITSDSVLFSTPRFTMPSPSIQQVGNSRLSQTYEETDADDADNDCSDEFHGLTTRKRKRSTKITKEDVRAAMILLQLAKS